MKNSPNVLGALSLLFALSACASSQSEAPSQVNKPLVEPQYRLQQDRKAFEEMRSQIPEPQKEENDEVAFMENLFLNPMKNPSDVRAQFSKALLKRRDKFQKDMQKLRENFVRKERKDRELATKNFEKERADFKARKPTVEESKEFYQALDQKRKDFYSEQKEKRDEFEAQVRDDRKNFEDYTREKQNEFNAKLKEFSERQRDLKKEKAEKKNNL